MIKYEWRRALSRDESAEIADLLRRCAAYDAEPEYSTIAFADVEQAMSQADSPVRHLVIWMLAHATAMGEPDQPERIAGLLRLNFTSKGVAEGVAVIDPDLRSIGIMTLLLEQVGVDTTAPDGWFGTGAHVVTGWARGNHPAASRLGNRFLIPRTRRVWKLIRPTHSIKESAAAPVLESIDNRSLEDLVWASPMTGDARTYALREAGRVLGVAALSLVAVESEQFGRCATVLAAIAAPDADTGSRRRLLDGAVAVAHEAGLSGVIVYTDSDDIGLVNACRLAGFQHDRTDVRFQLGGPR